MGLKGDLLSADLSNVFQMLAMNRKAGRLLIQDQGDLLNRRELYIEENRVALVEAPRERPAEALLLQAGLLDYRTLRDARGRATRYPITVLAALQQGQHVSSDALGEVDRIRDEEDVLEIFLWRNVRFALDESGLPPHDRPFFSLDQIVMEAARRQDEWLHATASGEGRYAIYERTEASPQEDELEPVHHMVLDEVDGISDRRDITHRTGLSRYFVDVALHALETAGFVHQLPMTDLIQGGDALLAADRTADALRLFRAALRHDRRNLTIHRRLAEALETHAPAKAAAHLKFCASEHAALGETREALDLLRAARDLVPTDLRPVEASLAILEEDPDAFCKADCELLDAGRRLLTLRRDVLDPMECLPLARRLAAVGRDDQELIETHARLSLRAGRKEEAATAYRKLAELRVNRGDIRGALDILRNLGSLDPRQRALYDQQIQRLQGRIKRTTGVRRRLRWVAMVLLLLGVLAGGYSLYRGFAEKHFAELPVADPNTIAEAEEQLRAYERVASLFPFTAFARQARDLANDRRDRIQLMRAGEKQRRDDEARHRKSLIDEAVGLMEAGKTALKRGDYDAALECFRNSREKAALPGVPSWIREQAERSFADVAAYVNDVARLLATVEAARDGGRYEEAFRILKEAHTRFGQAGALEQARIPLLLEILPPSATVLVAGAPAVRPQPAPLHGELKVEAQAPGFQARAKSVSLPPASARVAVLLSPEAVTTTILRDRPSALVGAGSRALAIGRSGGVAIVDGTESPPSEAYRARSLVSVSAAPVVTPYGVASLTRDGELRLLDPSTGAVSWAGPVLAGTDDLLDPVSVGRWLVVARTNGTAATVALDERRVAVTRSLSRQLTFLGATAEHVVVRGRDGVVSLHDPATLKSVRELDQSQPTSVEVTTTGSLAVFSGDRVTLVPLTDGAPSGSLTVTSPVVATWSHEGSVAWITGTTIHSWDGRVRQDLTLSAPVSRLLAATADGVVVQTAEGRTIALRQADLTPVAVLGDLGDPVAATLSATHLLVAYADGSLIATPRLR